VSSRSRDKRVIIRSDTVLSKEEEARIAKEKKAKIDAVKR